MSFKEPAPLNLPPALRYPSYRAYWLGSVASISGFQMLRFGQFWLIYEITGSALSLGYIGLANGLPAIALNLVGGVAADKVDQRRLIVVTPAGHRRPCLPSGHHYPHELAGGMAPSSHRLLLGSR